MNVVEVLIGGGSLAVLIITGLRAKFKDAQAEMDWLLADGLEAIDLGRWEDEVRPHSAMVDEDGWLR